MLTPAEHIRPILVETYWNNQFWGNRGNEYAAAKEILKTFGKRRDKWAIESIASTIRRRLWNDGARACLGEIVEIINRVQNKRRIA